MSPRLPIRGALALLCLALCACGGSEAGNPGRVSANGSNSTPDSAPALPRTYSAQILGAICDKLHACYPSLSINQCNAGLVPTSGFGPTLGIVSSMDTLGDLISLEQSGSIRANIPAAQHCLTDLMALACSNGQVQTAYDPANPTNFTSVPGLIPTSSTSCRGVF